MAYSGLTDEEKRALKRRRRRRRSWRRWMGRIVKRRRDHRTQAARDDARDLAAVVGWLWWTG